MTTHLQIEQEQVPFGILLEQLHALAAVLAGLDDMTIAREHFLENSAVDGLVLWKRRARASAPFGDAPTSSAKGGLTSTTMTLSERTGFCSRYFSSRLGSCGQGDDVLRTVSAREGRLTCGMADCSGTWRMAGDEAGCCTKRGRGVTVVESAT